MPPRAYFDTGIVSGLARRQMTPEERAATLRLIELETRFHVRPVYPRPSSVCSTFRGRWSNESSRPRR